ncbi:MAG: MFS transporter, partial [Gemmataceae bacterium]
FGRGAPFVALAGLSAVVWIVGAIRLPAIRGHLEEERRHPVAEYAAVLREPNHLRGFVFSFFLILGTFTVASFVGPVLAAMNGWSEQTLAVIYLTGGACTLVGTNVVGRFADRVPRLPLFRVLAFGALVMAVVVGNIQPGPVWIAALVTAAFMTCAAGRMVPAHAMLLGVAKPAVRGAFMSLNTAVQHFATGLAPTIAGAILIETPDRKLEGFPLVGLVSAGAAAVSLLLAGFLRAAPAEGTKSEVVAITPRSEAAEPDPACPA